MVVCRSYSLALGWIYRERQMNSITEEIRHDAPSAPRCQRAPGLAGKDEHGSHSRNLSQRFISQWLARRPQDGVTYRDIGQNPPLRQPRLDRVGLHARGASTTLDEGCPAESDRLVDELLAACAGHGTPLYNFGMPAALKAGSIRWCA